MGAQRFAAWIAFARLAPIALVTTTLRCLSPTRGFPEFDACGDKKATPDGGCSSPALVNVDSRTKCRRWESVSSGVRARNNIVISQTDPDEGIAADTH